MYCFLLGSDVYSGELGRFCMYIWFVWLVIYLSNIRKKDIFVFIMKGSIFKFDFDFFFVLKIFINL